MTRGQWIEELKKYLFTLPKEDLARALEYYNEIYNDKNEAGISEGEILYSFGNPSDAAKKILAEYGFNAGQADNGFGADCSREAGKAANVRQQAPAAEAPIAGQAGLTSAAWTDSAAGSAQAGLAGNSVQAASAAQASSSAYNNTAPQSPPRPPARKSIPVWAIPLIIFGALILIGPIIGVVAGVGGMLIGIFAGIWAVIIALLASSAAIVVGGFAGAAYSVYTMFIDFSIGLPQFGAALAVCGLGLLMLLVSIAVLKLWIKLNVALLKLFIRLISFGKIKFKQKQSRVPQSAPPI